MAEDTDDAAERLLARVEFRQLLSSPAGRSYRRLLCPVAQPEPEPEPEPGEPEPSSSSARFVAERLLRASQGDGDAAAALLAKILAFREQHGLPQIVDDPGAQALWRRLLSLLPVGYSPTPAACGAVVEVWAVGAAWPAEILAMCPDRAELTRAYLYHIECGQRAQHEAALALGLPHVAQQIMIHDLAGLAPRHVNLGCVSAVVGLLQTAEAHYPEILKVAIIINVPTLFASAWSALSAVLSAETVAKVTVRSDAGLDAITEAVGGLDRVPAVLGGTAPLQLGVGLQWGLPAASEHVIVVAARGEVVVKRDAAWLRQHGLLEVRGAAEEPGADERDEVGGASAPGRETWASLRFSTVDYPVAFRAEWVDAAAATDLVGQAEWEAVAELDDKYLSHAVPHELSLLLPDGHDRGLVRLTFANDYLVTGVGLWHSWLGAA